MKLRRNQGENAGENGEKGENGGEGKPEGTAADFLPRKTRIARNGMGRRGKRGTLATKNAKSTEQGKP